jgi:hypothetical protein
LQLTDTVNVSKIGHIENEGLAILVHKWFFSN